MKKFLFQKIDPRNRQLMLVISAILCLVYFIPVWKIVLKAPQYRDGLRLFIWLDKITGGNEFDLKNINILNHYVGMREIHASDFSEFQYMPYILGIMIAGALVTFFIPRVVMVLLGLLAFASTALAGLYDFHIWEYEYGHNLNPEAALSIPGISFEPPLLGCKAMMNFNTCSWPHAGATILGVCGAILVYVLAFEFMMYKKSLKS